MPTSALMLRPAENAMSSAMPESVFVGFSWAPIGMVLLIALPPNVAKPSPRFASKARRPGNWPCALLWVASWGRIAGELWLESLTLGFAQQFAWDWASAWGRLGARLSFSPPMGSRAFHDIGHRWPGPALQPPAIAVFNKFCFSVPSLSSKYAGARS